MYGPIRDLFREVLGHEAGAVTNEPPLEEGAPDITVSAPHPGQSGSEAHLPTVIVEAKDERNTVTNPREREGVLAAKAKYASIATRWFVLIDPDSMLARPVKDGHLDPTGDLVSSWRHPEGLDEFLRVFSPLSAERLGYDDVVAFDPHQLAFTNTATLFVPEERVEQFPFDLLLHSRIFRWTYAIGYRMGVLFRRRSHLYPENVRQLPWSDSLLTRTEEIEAIRVPLMKAYQLLHAKEEAILGLARDLRLASVRTVARERLQATLVWPDHFADDSYECRVAGPTTTVAPEGVPGRRVVTLSFGADLFDSLIVENDEVFGQYLLLAFRAKTGATLTRDGLLDSACPRSDKEATAFLAGLDQLDARDPLAEREELLDRLDGIIGLAFGLTAADIAEIQRDLKQDIFLRSLTVREPHTTTRLLGPRENLTRPDRYERI